MAENKKTKNTKNVHEKFVHTYPDGTTLVYYQQNLNKCTDVTVGFRIPRLDIPMPEEIIGVWKNKLVFYQDPDGLFRVPLIKPGLPHFFEHMIYSSLPDMDKNDFFDLFVRTNTHYNAFTTQDVLAAEFNCPSKHNEQIFSLFSKMLFREGYNLTDLENEKKPVFQELQRIKDSKIYHDNIYKELLYNNYDNLTNEELLGIDKKIISTFDEKQMLKFINAYFTKQNMVISVVSDKPFSEIKSLCEKNFVEKAPSLDATKVKTPEPVYSFTNDRLILTKNPAKNTANITFILKGTQNYEDNEIYSSIEDFILNNFNGRLMTKLRNNDGKVYTPFFEEENLPGISLKIFDAQTTPRNVKSVVDAMTEILTDLATKGITDAEFEGFKEMWENRRERAASVKHNKSYVLFNKIINSIEPFVGQYNKKISNLTKEDINNYFKETYSHAKCCLLVSGNFKDKDIRPFKEILKFRPLDKYMDEEFIDKTTYDEFLKYLVEFQKNPELGSKIKYVITDDYLDYLAKTEENNKPKDDMTK